MNILITADWHIANYDDYNFTDGARLNQFLTLADRIVELGYENNCKYLVIAGDLVDVPTMVPNVLHVVKSVIEKLHSFFPTIYYILGQHDLATKSKTQNITDTAVSLFDGLKYMHHKMIQIGDCIIGFQNWNSGKQDTSWIDRHLDFLIGHYTKSKLFGQEIDESVFDYMIHGDIHNDQEIGKFISIGNPIQNDMSSMGNGSVIILDTTEKSFKRVRVDEDHSRFLRIDYTDKEELEGFLNPLQYYIYKPSTESKQIDNVEELPEYTDLDNLLNKYCTENDLVDINNECLTKCISINDVDFNYQLINFKIHGYRSVVDFSIDLVENDRVLFLGNNGSGKSSIMNGLNDLFTYNRYLKNQKSDFTDDIILEMTLKYQNKTYVIKKGSEWGLTIDGNEIGYNNKTDFEDDLLIKLPFMKYHDLFFIHSGISNLSDQLNLDRKIELIMRFFRLNKLDALSETAIQLSDELSDEIANDKNKIRDKESQKSYIVTSINQIPETIKTLSEVDLLKKVTELSDLRDKKSCYDKWKNDINFVNSDISTYQNLLNDKKDCMSLDINDLRSKMEKVDEKLKENSDKLIDVNTKWNKWMGLHREMNDLMKKGKELKYRCDELDKKLCPTCHRPLSDEPEHKHLIDSTKAELYAVREQFKVTRTNYYALLGFKPESTVVDERYYMDQSEALLEEKNKLITYKSGLQTKIHLYESAERDYNKYKSKLEELNKKLDELNSMNFEEVKLPMDITQQEMELQSNLNKLHQYQQFVTDIEILDKEIKELSESIEPKKNKINKLIQYSQLTSRTGKVIEVILTNLAERFTSEKIMYKVSSGITRKNNWIKFESYYKVKNKYRSYESLSDGQKNIVDLDFLSKLFSFNRIGLLVLDEYLKHLDENNSAAVSDILAKMNVNTLLISTHSSNYPIFTKKVFLELTKDGKTKNTIV